MEYDDFSALIVQPGSGALILFAIYTIHIFSRGDEQVPTGFMKGALLFWVLFPPLWFYLEYWLMANGYIVEAGDRVDLERFKNYSDYAANVWAAVLACVLFLYPKASNR
ncbi:MAG: hypothetical protein AAF662_16735 [Pseudomonadota bacterium]